jgi:hypothetical protein
VPLPTVSFDFHASISLEIPSVALYHVHSKYVLFVRNAHNERSVVQDAEIHYPSSNSMIITSAFTAMSGTAPQETSTSQAAENLSSNQLCRARTDLERTVQRELSLETGFSLWFHPVPWDLESSRLRKTEDNVSDNRCGRDNRKTATQRTQRTTTYF